jgi:protocatechuate 3,4-dioxygenase beta subunit
MKSLRIWIVFLCWLTFSSAFAEDYPQESNQTDVSGYVLEKLSGKPIQAAEVFYRTSQGATSTTTDANGFFVLTGFDTQHEPSISIIAKNFASSRISITPVAGKILENTKIELMPSSKVAGFIKDENGNPVANATVTVFHLTNQDVKTDTNGFYEIDSLDPAFGQYQLKVTTDSYSTITTSFSPADAGQTAKLDIVLKPGVTVFGQVTDLDGNLLQGTTVGNTESTIMWNNIKTTTDANGYYELKNVDKGLLVLWAMHPKYPPYVERLNINAQESEKQINIKFENPKPLHGKVVDTKGNPVQDVKVNIRNVNGVDCLNNHNWFVTDSQGKFTIHNAPPSGKVVLQLMSQTVPNIMPEIKIGKAEHIIEVQRAGKIYGCVIDNTIGKPVSKFNVKLGISNKSKKFVGGYSVTREREGHNFDDSNGFFDTGTEILPIGAFYAVTVYAQGYDLLIIDPVEVLPNSNEPNRIVFKLMPPTAIGGKVINENNEPVAGASVRWFSETNRLDMYGDHWDSTDTTITDSNGRFRFNTIGSGKRGIYITASGFAPYIDANLILPDDKKELSEIVLEKAAEVYGTVYKDGKPAAGVQLSCHFYEQSDLQQMGYIGKRIVTDANGCYVLSDLPAGKLQILTMSPAINQSGQTTVSKNVILSAGQKLKLDLGNEQGLTVTGQVRIGQMPLSNANISFRDPDNNFRGAVSDSNGFYMVTGLAKGKYSVETHYIKPQNRSTFSSSAHNPEEYLQDNQNIDVNSDMTLNIDFGALTASGKIPPEFIGTENLRLLARRWNPQTSIDNEKQTHTINWESVNSQAKTDPNGSFVFSNLKPGRYHLVLIGNNRRAISEVFEVGARQPGDIKFNTLNAKLLVTISDAQNKQPIADATCSLANEVQIPFIGLRSDPNKPINKTNESGLIEFNLPKGVYNLSVQKDGFLPATKDNIQVDANSNSTIQIPLEKSENRN